MRDIDKDYPNACGYLGSSNSTIKCPFWDMILFLSPSTTWPKHSIRGSYSYEHISHPSSDFHTGHMWLCLDTSCTLPIAQISLALRPTLWSLGGVHPRNHNSAPWNQGALPHLDHNSYSLSSPLDRAWWSTKFPTGFPSLPCPCPLVPCMSTRKWSQGVIGQGNAKRICFYQEWRVTIKHLSPYLLYSLCASLNPSLPYLRCGFQFLSWLNSFIILFVNILKLWLLRDHIWCN